MPQSGNLYDILGLPRYAHISEVRHAFRRLAVLYHPDKNPGDAVAEEHFKQISAAYNILGDEQKKHEYDLRLSGLFTYTPVQEETKEEKLRKRRERADAIRKQKREQEEREIKATYEKAQKNMPYHWRYAIAGAATIGALFIILSNWYLYDFPRQREPAFFRMFLGYLVSLIALIFFLSSLFKKWNAVNIDKPYNFDIRNRLSIFFILYVVVMFNFSFNVPYLYKKTHLTFFGKETQARLTNGRGTDMMLYYIIDGKHYAKVFETKMPYYKPVDVNVTVKYSSVSPYIVEIEGLRKGL